jgi:hypothetical protein
MESEAKRALITIFPSQDDELIPTPHLHEDILRHIATFLDFQSLRQFRLLSPEWNAACLAILMKRGTYNLNRKCDDDVERADLYGGAKHYSSWKISYSVYSSAKLLHDKRMWGNVSSLTIHQSLSLSRGFVRWAWETIESRCPNLQDLTVIFENFSHHGVDRKVDFDYEQAIQGTPNESFPKIANLSNLCSVHFRGICDKRTAYFAQNLLQATTSSLRHLHFCPITKPGLFPADTGAFRIFEYLKRNPTLTKNLQSFGFILGRYVPLTETDDESYVSFRLKNERSDFIQFVDLKTLPLRFSKNLRTLFWDSPYYHRDGQEFLPGILTFTVSSSLVHLSLNGKVENLLGNKTDADPVPHQIKMSFPIYPVLRSLKLGFHAAESISVPDLIHSAPNLASLEVKLDLTGKKSWNSLNCIGTFSSVWQRIIEESVSHPKHSQLRSFCTDISFKRLSDLQMISSKFPNLVELQINTVEEVDDLDSFLNSLKSTHPKLQRLSWTFNGCHHLTLDELFRHLVCLPELLPALTSYTLERNDNVFFAQDFWPNSMDDMKETSNILLNLRSSSNSDYSHSCLHINLLMKRLSCECYPLVVPRNCRQCYLQQFIRNHNFPIQIPSKRDRLRKRKNDEPDDRFAHCRICK